ncbi:restriction endonuclease subunit S [Treponema sp.]|uniref:restriction endonuclease subunit S n=1 Tax=Treponema sp. TaxID=166 RepID=UPI00388E1BCA
MKMEEWKECKVKDITSLITKGTTPSMIGANFTTNGIKFIKSECILENSRLLDSSKYTFISSETNERLKRSQIIENDILFSMAGMFLGKTGIATKDDVPANTNQAVAIIRIISEKADFKYVYYFLNQKTLITYINGISGQSAQPNINLQQIGDLEIKLPPLPTQQKIAAILSSLDDKIELNNKINTNLEQQAQALFKNWFVDGSEKSHTIGDYIVPKRGKNLLSKDAIPGEVPVVAGGLEPATYHNTANTKAPVLTISASGANAGFVNLWNIPVWSSDSSYIDSEMTNDVYFWYILLKLRQKEIFDSQTGSAQPHIYPQHISVMPIAELDFNKVYKFTKQVTPFFEQIGANQQENLRLIALRDTLLPKLMNGEIEVDKVKL